MAESKEGATPRRVRAKRRTQEDNHLPFDKEWVKGAVSAAVHEALEPVKADNERLTNRLAVTENALQCAISIVVSLQSSLAALPTALMGMTVTDALTELGSNIEVTQDVADAISSYLGALDDTDQPEAVDPDDEWEVAAEALRAQGLINEARHRTRGAIDQTVAGRMSNFNNRPDEALLAEDILLANAIDEDEHNR